MHAIGIAEEERDSRIEDIFEVTMAKNFPNL